MNDDPSGEARSKGDDLVVAIRWAASTACLTVSGAVDSFSEAILAGAVDQVLDDGARHVMVDLRLVDFLGAPGYWILAGARARLAGSGGSLHLVGAPSVARAVAARARLDIGVFGDPESLAAL